MNIVDNKKQIDELKNIQHMQSVEENFKVTKSNILIEAMYKLTANEQKIILMIISLINPLDDQLKIYRVNVKTIQKILKNQKNSSFYSELKKMTFNLLKKPFKFIEYYTDRKGNERIRELQANWFSSCEYVNGEGCIEFCFDPKVRKHLIKLEDNFTSYKLGYAMRLKSRHSIRMYELLKKVHLIKTIVFDLSELRKILKIGENEYKQYSDFRKRIIDVAKKELKEKTDIFFTYKEYKTGRKIDKLKISIKENVINKIEKKSEIDIFGLNPLAFELIKYGLSEDQSKQVIEKRDSKFIKNKIEQLEWLLQNKSYKVKGKSRYLYNSSIKDWNDDDYLEYVSEKEEEKFKKNKKREINKRKKFQKEYDNYVQNNLLLYENLTESDRNKVDKIVNTELDRTKKAALKISKETLEMLKKDLQKEAIKQECVKILSFVDWLAKSKKSEKMRFQM